MSQDIRIQTYLLCSHPAAFSDIAEHIAQIALFGDSISTKPRVCFETLSRRRPGRLTRPKVTIN
ncbi:hypothetical protein N7527_009192 [Penicillium freii]|nr:hypothetical protein N7527_009192 [Penicillium freii]